MVNAGIEVRVEIFKMPDSRFGGNRKIASTNYVRVGVEIEGCQSPDVRVDDTNEVDSGTSDSLNSISNSSMGRSRDIRCQSWSLIRSNKSIIGVVVESLVIFMLNLQYRLLE